PARPPAAAPEALSPDDDTDHTEASAIALGDDHTDADGEYALEEGEAVSIAVRTGSFEVIKDVEPDPSPSEQTDSALSVKVSEDDWLAHLRDLLEILGGPRPMDGASTQAVAAVRTVAAATTNLEVRWSLYPEAVQQALLGLVGARGRRLQG